MRTDKTQRLGTILYLVLHAVAWEGWCDAQTAKQAAEQHAALGLNAPPMAKFRHTTHPDAQWFSQGNFGLFIHWGISSVNANNEISWAMLKHLDWNPHPIQPADYWAQAKRFHPDKYDPDKWLAAAKAAGFTYAVLTTRHHDGFAMWPSRHGELNTATYGKGEDLVRPFVQACRKHGLKVGLYFSGGNWHYERHHRSFSHQSKGTPNSPHLGVNYEPVTLAQSTPEHEAGYRALNAGQLEELLTQYGKIDLLWFDSGFAGLTAQQIRNWQPGIVINNRTSDVTPDYDSSYEGKLPEQRPGGWWEACMSAVGSWGYRKDQEQSAMPAPAILSTLVKIRSWGGNLLLNFAPRADGTMPDLYYTRMTELAAWMKQNRDSLIGCAAGTYPEGSTVPVTTRGRTWYLHALPEFQDETVVLAGVPEPREVCLLATGQKLNFSFEATHLAITLPKTLRTPWVEVIMVRW